MRREEMTCCRNSSRLEVCEGAPSRPTGLYRLQGALVEPKGGEKREKEKKE
jgi:hypothetical protein